MAETYYALEKFAEADRALSSIIETMPIKRRAIDVYREKNNIPRAKEMLAELSRRFRHIVTVEEHSVVGGFGSAVCEVLAEMGSSCRVHRIGMEDVYSTIVGTQQYLREAYRMDEKAICERTLAWLRD